MAMAHKLSCKLPFNTFLLHHFNIYAITALNNCKTHKIIRKKKKANRRQCTMYITQSLEGRYFFVCSFIRFYQIEFGQNDTKKNEIDYLFFSVGRLFICEENFTFFFTFIFIFTFFVFRFFFFGWCPQFTFAVP